MKSLSIVEAVKKFRPEKVVLVIAYDNKNNRASGMVAGNSTFCSSDPYMIAVALWKEGYTHNLIHEKKEFVVAVPNKKLKKTIEIFGNLHGDVVDKFKKAKLLTEKADLVKAPLLSEATINYECKLVKEVETGDHITFIGKIVAAHVNEDKKILLNMGKKDGKRIFKEF